MSKRNNTFTRFIGDIVDDTKDLVDDLLDRAKGLETDVRDAVKDAIDDDEADNNAPASSMDVAELQLALAELTRKVNQLAELQLVAAAPTAPAAPAGKPAVRTSKAA